MKKLYVPLIVILVSWVPWFMGAFDATKPAATTSLRSSNPEILANWVQLQTAINNEHLFSGTSGATQTGDHTQGQARCFFQSGAPGTRIDGSNFLSTDDGSLWLDSDDNAFYIMTDFDAVVTADKWAPVSTEVIETLLASARIFGDTLDVTGTLAALGAATVGTTFDVTGAATLGDTLGVTGETTLTGGLAATTMSGALAMGSNPITGIEASDAAGEAVIYEQVFNSLAGATDSIGETTIGDLEVKWGKITRSGNDTAVDFTDLGISDFTAACFQAYAVSGTNANIGEPPGAYGIGVTGFTIQQSNAADTTMRWFAIGR